MFDIQNSFLPIKISLVIKINKIIVDPKKNCHLVEPLNLSRICLNFIVNQIGGSVWAAHGSQCIPRQGFMEEQYLLKLQVSHCSRH